MLQKFITRPVLSTVISILITLLGLLGLMDLPISTYPDIAPPSVTVTANYPGANAATLVKSVAIPLEEAINGVENMTYMTSNAGNDGQLTITINFKTGTNADIAAVNVQNRVAKVTSMLPQEVVQQGVKTQKRQNSTLMFCALYSDSKEYDQTFLQNYAQVSLLPSMLRVEGVGEVSVFGAKEFSMRIWLDPERMARYGITPDEVASAIRDQSVEAAPGKFGENSTQAFEYVISYRGKYNQVADYEQIVVRSTPEGELLRLQDVARIELTAFNSSTQNLAFGKDAMIFAVYQTAGSNAKKIIEDLEVVLNNAGKDFPKGIHYEILLNNNDFLNASIGKVLHTLMEAFILVFIVVFIFLQDFRSTLIPAIAVPVAIVGTFFFLNLFGFTINLLTLFALVLAIGIVVDDAIVVVEAVHAKMSGQHLSPKKATISAMNEITGAIISITLIMSAVFVPVSFLGGPAGVFYKQFGITLAVAILISAVNALTLSPALCALLLKQHEPQAEGAKQGPLQRFYGAFNTGFEHMSARYVRSVTFFARNKTLTLGVTAAAIVLAVYMMRTTPATFVPTEDQGTIFADVSLPAGASMERTMEVLNEVEQIMKGVPEIQSYMTVGGNSLIYNSRGSNYGFMVGKLKHWDDRKDSDLRAILGQLYAKTAHIQKAQVVFFVPPTIPGFGNVDGFEMILQDQSGGKLDKLASVAKEFTEKLSERPEIARASTGFRTDFPQYEVKVEVDKCKKLGVNVQALLGTLQAFYGSRYVSDFNAYNKQYKVMMQAHADDRQTPSSLEGVYVKNNQGEMLPISALVRTERIYGPQNITRFNLFNSASISGSAAPGYSTGQAIAAAQEVAEQVLPRGYSYDWAGMTREELASGNQAPFIFALSLIFVYFLLAAQYESYILPFSVLLSIPTGIFGAFTLVRAIGLPSSIYLQVALIMLIGLLAKNAILIVEFAIERRRLGMGLLESAARGAESRLRPILMTSFAFILGLVPLAISTGAGAVGNISIGMAAIGGMLIGTACGIFVIPGLFVIFQGLHERLFGIPVAETEEEETQAVHAH